VKKVAPTTMQGLRRGIKNASSPEELVARVRAGQRGSAAP
jgi:hypothetical protein